MKRGKSQELVLVNGRIVAADEHDRHFEALLVRDGRIAAAGTPNRIRNLAGREARVIDLGGRTVIPGLIDSHIHAIRAALSYSTEVHWFGAASVAEALDFLFKQKTAYELPK